MALIFIRKRFKRCYSMVRKLTKSKNAFCVVKLAKTDVLAAFHASIRTIFYLFSFTCKQFKHCYSKARKLAKSKNVFCAILFMQRSHLFYFFLRFNLCKLYKLCKKTFFIKNLKKLILNKL